MGRSEAAGGVGGGGGAERAGGMQAGRELLASEGGRGQEASLAKGTAIPIQHFSAVCCTFSQGAPSYYTCIAAVCTSSQLPAGCYTGFGRQQESCACAVLPAGCLALGRTRPFSRACRGAALVTALWLLTAPQL